jgi:hypothetical protein
MSLLHRIARRQGDPDENGWAEAQPDDGFETPWPEKARRRIVDQPEGPGTEVEPRLRHLRRRRDEQLRDLGGLVFDLYRFGQQRDPLVRAKLEAIVATDKALEHEGAAPAAHPAEAAHCVHCGAATAPEQDWCLECGATVTGGADTPRGWRPR